MIKTQYPYIDGNGKERKDLVRTYSDEGKPILQNETGNVYDEAIDFYPCQYTYTETEPETAE